MIYDRKKDAHSTQTCNIIKIKIKHAINKYYVEMALVQSLYNPGEDISDKLYFFCEIAPSGKGWVSIFQWFFASMDKMLILAVGLGAKL